MALSLKEQISRPKQLEKKSKKTEDSEGKKLLMRPDEASVPKNPTYATLFAPSPQKIEIVHRYDIVHHYDQQPTEETKCCCTLV